MLTDSLKWVPILILSAEGILDAPCPGRLQEAMAMPQNTRGGRDGTEVSWGCREEVGRFDCPVPRGASPTGLGTGPSGLSFLEIMVLRSCLGG